MIKFVIGLIVGLWFGAALVSVLIAGGRNK